jgi:hypothetical protein
MNWTIKKPFEVMVLLLTIYYSLIVFLFEPIILSVKLSYIISAWGVFLLFVIFGIAFEKELDWAKYKLFSLFMTRKFTGFNFFFKLLTLIFLVVPIIVITSFCEYLISSIFIKGGSIAIGFPLSIYSFSASKLITANLAIDLFIHISVLYFVGYILMKEDKKI